MGSLRALEAMVGVVVLLLDGAYRGYEELWILPLISFGVLFLLSLSLFWTMGGVFVLFCF